MVTWPAVDALPDPSWGRAGHSLLLNAHRVGGQSSPASAGASVCSTGPSPLLAYSAEASYPFYILHQTVIVAVGFYVRAGGVGGLGDVPGDHGRRARAVARRGTRSCGACRPLRFLFGMKPAAEKRRLAGRGRGRAERLRLVAAALSRRRSVW